MIPGLFGASQLSSNRLMRSLDDAKNDAAEFVLTQIFPQAQMPQLAQPFTEFSELYSQEGATFNQRNVQTTAPGASATAASNDQNSGGFGGVGMIGGQAAAEIPMPTLQAAPQYVLDPSGQYLMQYPTPGWQ